MYEFMMKPLTWEAFWSEAIWGLLFVIAGRVLVWVFNVHLRSRWREVAFWVAAPLCVFVLMGVLRQATSHDIRDPLLKGEIDTVVFGEIPELVQDGTAVTLIVSIRNVGSPTIVEGWELSVDLPGGKALTAERHEVPDGLLVPRGDGTSWTLHGVDALYHKTEVTPIATGGMQRGVLLFTLSGVKREVVAIAGTTYTLRYKDVIGKQYSNAAQFSGQLQPLQYLPGLTSPRRPPQRHTP
jgi:uncharacterized membrane protein